MTLTDLNTTIDNTFDQISKSREDHIFTLIPREVGSVISVSEGVVRVSGLPGAGFEELLKFPNDLLGIAYNIDEEEIGVILLGEDSLLNTDDEVERTSRVMDIPVGNALIGRVINPLGEPMDDKGSISCD